MAIGSNPESTPRPSREKNSSALVRQPKLTLTPPPKTNQTPSRRDLRRWARWRAGETDEEIAKSDGGTSILKVQASIQRVLAYKSYNSLELVAARVNEITLDQLPDMDRIITELANATRTEGDKIEIDYATRRSAIDALSKLRDLIKENKQTVNIGDRSIQQINSSGNVFLGAGRSFEDRMRKKREEHGLRNEEVDQPGPPEIEAEFDDLDDDDGTDGDAMVENADSSSQS